MSKLSTLLNQEGSWRETIDVEAKVLSRNDAVRGGTNGLGAGQVGVVISNESSDGDRFATRNVLPPITSTHARSIAAALIQAADEADALAVAFAQSESSS